MSRSRSEWWRLSTNWGDTMDLGRLESLLGIPKADISQDNPLRFIVDDVEETIKNYCCLEEVLRGLVSTAYRMAMDVFRAEAVGETGSAVSVTSMRGGDTSTTSGNRSDSIKDTVLKDYKAQFSKYRKLRW